MQRIPVSEIRLHPGHIVNVAGFVQAVRDQKRMQFVVVADRTGGVQVAHARTGEGDSLAAAIAALTPGTAVAVTGEVVVDARIRAGGVEVRAHEIRAEPAAARLPIDASSSSDLRLDYRWLDLRRPEQLLAFEVQTAAEHAMRRFWIERGFLEIHSPKLMAAASESGAELFRLPYFGGEATLAQSPQFYKQMAIAAGFERVFEIGPVFRANPSFTSRHDTEFTSVDVEIAWIESHEDVMRLEEEWLAFVLGEVAEHFGERVFDAVGVQMRVPTIPFPRVTLAEAHALLGGAGVREDGDLEPEGERRLCEIVRSERGHDLVFVTDYPAALRPFYHMRSEADPAQAKGFDLLWNGVEVTSGAQREHRPDRLLAQIRERGLEEGPLAEYVSFFRYGCPPHGGFGFGLSRMLMVLLGRPNVREVTFLPRGPGRLRP
jgi:aspartyl-tRNA synthetase